LISRPSLLRSITAASNDLLFRVVEDVAEAHAGSHPHEWSAALLARECEMFERALHEERNGFVGRHQQVLLDTLQKDVVAGVA